jgi:replicative DNA helicase
MTSSTGFEVAAGDGDRLPPQDMAAEQCVLGAMLLSKDAIADAAELVLGGDYYRPAHETIHDTILDLYGRGEPVDAVTVAAELGKRGSLARVGGAPYLHTLIASVPAATTATYYATIVRDKAILRRLVDAGTRILQLGYTAEGDLTQIVDEAQAVVHSATEGRTSEDYQVLGALLEGTLDEIESAGNRGGKLVGIPTGFTDLDKLTTGLHPGQLIVVAGRPGMGKSTLGLDFARSAAVHHSLPTAFFSLEMGRTEITMKLLSAESRVALQSMREGSMRDEDWLKLSQKMMGGPVSEAPLFIDDSPHLSMTEIRAKCRRLKQQHNLKLVIVDYLQLMSSGKRV